MEKYLQTVKKVVEIIIVLLIIVQFSYGRLAQDEQKNKEIIIEIIETNYGLIKPIDRVYFRLYNSGVIEYERLVEDQNGHIGFKWIKENKQLDENEVKDFQEIIKNEDFKMAKTYYNKLVFGVDDDSVTTVTAKVGKARKVIKLKGLFLSLTSKKANLYYPHSILFLIQKISEIRPKNAS